MDVIMIIFEDQKWPTEPKRNIFSVYVELVSQAQCSRLLLLNIAIKSAHCIVISRVILDVPWKHRNVFGKLPRNICGEKNSLDSTIPFLNLNWNTRFDTELIGKICVSIQQEGLDFLLYTKKTIAIACIIRKLDDSFTHIINYPHHLFLPFFPPQTKLFTLPIKFQKRELH